MIDWHLIAKAIAYHERWDFNAGLTRGPDIALHTASFCDDGRLVVDASVNANEFNDKAECTLYKLLCRTYFEAYPNAASRSTIKLVAEILKDKEGERESSVVI